MRGGLSRWSLSFSLFLVVMVMLCLSGCGGGGGGGSSSSSSGGNSGGGGSAPVVASKPVGPDGDIVEVTDSTNALKGASVAIPQNALSNSTNITISSVSTPPAFAGAENIKAVDFGPSGTKFEAPVTITVPYDPAKVQDENNLLVYTYDEANGYWKAEKTVNIDTVNYLITALADHFSTYTTQDNITKAAVNLFQATDKTLSASVVITTPFDKMPLTPSIAYCSNGTSPMSELLAWKPRAVTFRYIARLKKYNWGPLLDSTVAEKVLYYETISVGSPPSYTVGVSNENRSPWFSGYMHLIEDLFGWYSGAPALFKFGVEPELGKEYYIDLDLEVNVLGCAQISRYNLNGQAQRTSYFAPQTNVDTDEDGITNAYDSKTPDTTAPSQITGLALTPVSSNQINLSWNKSTDNVAVTGYKIYRQKNAFSSVNLDSTLLIKTIYSDTPSFSNTGLDPSTKYCYRVLAFDAAGNKSTYTEDCATTPAAPETTPPTIPTGLLPVTVSKSQIDLSWNSSSDNVGVKGYKIYRDGNFIKSANTISVSDFGLQAGTNYCYQVSAFDAAGNESSRTSQVCKTTLPEPDRSLPTTPTGLTATAISISQIKLSWNASTDNVKVQGYRVYRNGSRIETTDGTSTQDAGLNPDTQYCYTVAAVDSSNNVSPQSSQQCATTHALPVETTYTIAGKITLNGAGLQSVTITLTGTGSTTATTDSNGNYSFTGAQNGSYTITPSLAGYSFTPSSIPITVDNGDVTVQEITASTTVTIPSAPTSVSASAGDGQITVSWGGVSGATSYNIYWSMAPGVTKSNGTPINNVTSPFSHTGLTNGTNYYYVVTAVNSVGESGESTQVSAKPTSGSGDAVIIW